MNFTINILLYLYVSLQSLLIYQFISSFYNIFVKIVTHNE